MTSNFHVGLVKGERPTLSMPQTFQPPPPPQHELRKSSNKFEVPTGPGDDYICLIRLKNGKTCVKCSPSVKPQRDHILGGALKRFKECLSHGTVVFPNTSHDTTASQPLPNCGLSSMIPDDSISYIFPRKHKRQRRSSTAMDDFGSNSDDEQGPFSGFSGTTSRKLVQLVVGDDSAMNKWYEDAFHTIQQVVCRSIAKLWIKRIQPKKQSTNPYNGACSKDKDMPKDPNRTRPPYWPPHVKHKEPDHINKEERVMLLVWLITHTPQLEIGSPRRPGQDSRITANDLKDAIEERRGDISSEKWEIIEEVIRVRSIQEQYLREEIDKDTCINAMDLSHESRRSRCEPEAHVTDNEDESSAAAAEEGEEVDLPDESSRQSVPVAVNTTSKQITPSTGHDRSMLSRNQAPRLRNLADGPVAKVENLTSDILQGANKKNYHIEQTHQVSPINHGIPQWYSPVQQTLPTEAGLPHAIDAGVSLRHHSLAFHWPTTIQPDMFNHAAFAHEDVVPLQSPLYNDDRMQIPMTHDGGPCLQYNHPYGQPALFIPTFPTEQQDLTLRPAPPSRHEISTSDSAMQNYYQFCP